MKHLQRWISFINEQFKYPQLYKEGQSYKGVTEFPKKGDIKYVYITSVSGEAVIDCIVLDEKGNIDMEYMSSDSFPTEFIVNERGISPQQLKKHIPGKSQLKPTMADVQDNVVFITGLKPINKEQIPNHKQIDNFLDRMKKDNRPTGLEKNQLPGKDFNFDRKIVNSEDTKN